LHYTMIQFFSNDKHPTSTDFMTAVRITTSPNSLIVNTECFGKETWFRVSL